MGGNSAQTGSNPTPRKFHSDWAEDDPRLREFHSDWAEDNPRLREFHSDWAEDNPRLREFHSDWAEDNPRLREFHSDWAEDNPRLREFQLRKIIAEQNAEDKRNNIFSWRYPGQRHPATIPGHVTSPFPPPRTHRVPATQQASLNHQRPKRGHGWSGWTRLDTGRTPPTSAAAPGNSGGRHRRDASDSRTFYIRRDGTDTNNCGFSTTTPCKTLSGLLSYAPPPWTPSTIYINTDTSLTLNDGELQSNHKQHLKFVSGSPDRVLNVTIYSSTFNGTSLDIDNGGFSLLVQNCTFNGAGIRIQSSTLEIEGCLFQGNTVEEGGAVYSNASTVTITNSVMTNNEARAYCGWPETCGGGAVFSWDSNITITNSNMNSNSAEWGGAVFSESSTITITNSNMTGNNARWGGAVYSEDSSTITITNSNMTGNNANNGGAVCSTHSSTITITNSNMNSNNATFGGAVSSRQSSTIKITDSNMNSNNATLGGAVYSEDSSTITITNSNMTGNNANKGGAIQTEHDSTLVINGTEIQDNVSKTKGGAISAFSKCKIHINSCRFIGNNANTSSGGAVFLENDCKMESDKSLFQQNEALGAGGAIVVLEHSMFLDAASSFNNNLAFDAGGAIFVDVHSGLQMTDSNFVNNSVRGLFDHYSYSEDCPQIEQERDAGAILIRTYSNATFHRCNFTGNQAADDGGAIFIKTFCNVTMKDCHFEFNVAKESGGSIVIENSEKITIESCTFYNEQAVDGHGGSLCILNDGHCSITDSSFSHCQATFGGALSAMALSHVAIEKSDISDCVSSKYGGGLFIDHKSQVNIKSTTIQRSRALNGSAVMVFDASKIYLENSHLHNNSAKMSGAGIACLRGTVNTKNVIIKNNSASDAGAGIYIDQCIASLTSTTFEQNKATNKGGGILSTTGSTIDMHNCKGRENMASRGGFMYTTHKSITNIFSLKVSPNTADIGDIILAADKSDVRIHFGFQFTNTSDNSMCVDTKNAVHGIFDLEFSWNVTKGCGNPANHDSGIFTKCFLDNSSCHCRSKPDEKILHAKCTGLSKLPGTDMFPLTLGSLDLSRNGLVSLYGDFAELPCLQNLLALNLSQNQLTGVPHGFIETLLNKNMKRLDFSNNNLENLPKSIRNVNAKVWLSGNNFVCTCNLKWLKDWIKNDTGLIQDWNDIYCQVPKGEKKRIVHLSDQEMGCPVALPPRVLPSWVIPVILVLVLIIALVSWVRFKRNKLKLWLFLKFGIKIERHENKVNLDEVKTDAFISFSSHDQEWMKSNVLFPLEELGYRLCHHTKHFVAGTAISKNIEVAIQQSRKMIAVVSRNYLKSPHCGMEFQMAFEKANNGHPSYLTVVMLEDDPPLELMSVELKRYITTTTYLEVTDLKLFKGMLHYAMPRDPIQKLNKAQGIEMKNIIVDMMCAIHTYKNQGDEFSLECLIQPDPESQFAFDSEDEELGYWEETTDL